MTKGCARALVTLLGCFSVSLGCGPEGGTSGGAGAGSGNSGAGLGAGTGSGRGGASGGKGGASGGGTLGGDLKPSEGGGVGNGEMPCAVKKFELDRQPPELMLVLDRSGSMQRDAEGRTPGNAQFQAPSRWQATVEALNDVTMTTQEGVAWGLKMFPFPKVTTQTDPLACKGDAPPNLDPAFNSHTALMDIVRASAPPLDIGTTPTRAAIAAVTTYLKGRTTPNPKFILLATDGEPNECANPNNPDNVRSPTRNADATVAAVKAANDAGFPVYVVGLAVGSAAQTMNQLAEAGGRALDGATKFYSVTSKAELATALASIAGAVANCTFTLGTAPPDPEAVAVDVGGRRLARDRQHKDGWDYSDPTQKVIQLYGPACEDVKTGKVKDAQISWTCANVPIP